ncbi:hypothetical protein LTR85_009078 [Meristemomyces frigidus]|nr:hypothetical protein LTR85_009078 [Meristemomyces frigidus]
MALFSAVVLMDIYGVPAFDEAKAAKLNRSYYTSEYLFYGPLRNPPSHRCYEAVPWTAICNNDINNALSVFTERSPSAVHLCKRVAAHRATFASGADTYKDILSTVVQLGKLFGEDFSVVMITALTTLLCGPRVPAATHFRRDLSRFQLRRPVDADSIIRFDFVRHVDAGLSEVVGMYQSLSSMMRLSVEAEKHQHELYTAFKDLNIQEGT